MNESGNRIRTDKSILDFNDTSSREELLNLLGVLSERYNNLSIISVGQTVGGKPIPMVNLGGGTKNVVYIGSCKKEELIISQLLMRFINEYCEVRRANRRIFNQSLPIVEESRSISVIPLLDEADAQFVLPAICFDNRVKLIIELRRGDGRICYDPGNPASRALMIGQSLSRISSLPLVVEPFTGYFARERNLPFYSVAVRTQAGESFFQFYSAVREMLFVSPILV